MSIKSRLGKSFFTLTENGSGRKLGEIHLLADYDIKALLELVERVEAAKEHLSVGYPVESFQLLLVALSRITED